MRPIWLFGLLMAAGCTENLPPSRAIPPPDATAADAAVPHTDGPLAPADGGAEAPPSRACRGSLLDPGPRQLVDLRDQEFVDWGADLDGDGDTDFVIGGRFRTSILRNDGAGRLVSTKVSDGRLLGHRAADLDANGAADLIVTGGVSETDQSIAVLLGDGNGGFTRRAVGTLPGESTATAVVADVDRDGKGDVVVVTRTIQDSRVPAAEQPPLRARVRAFLTRGDHFESRVLADDPGVPANVLAAGDLDSDGDSDLVVQREGGIGGVLQVLWNDAGHFTMTAAPPAGYLEPSPLILDADGDGRADIVGGTTYLHNDGDRTFTAVPLVPHTFGHEPSFAGDVDGDGDTDLLFRASFEMIVLRREGVGRFGTTRWPISGGLLSGSLEPTLRLALADLDGDGKPEIVTSDLAGRVLQMSPLAPPATPHATALIAGGQSVAAVDMDKDGDLDLVAVDRTAVRVLANDGGGQFTATGPVATPPPAGRLLTQAIADLDGDGRPDLLVGGEHQVTPFFNRGRQLEAGPALALATSGPDGIAVAPLAALAAADLDGDGDVDVAIGNGTRLGERAAGGLSVALNLGGGRFAPPVFTADATIDVKALAIADLDRDGQAEIVTASRYGLTQPAADWKSVALWRAAADGSVQVAARREILPLLASMLIVDLDGDGAPEVVLGQNSTDSLTIEWNDGKGGVARTTNHRAGWPVEALAAADLDGDGDLDLAAGASFSGDVTLLLNDGRRGFTLGAVLPGQDATGLVAADLDGRCGVDLVVGQAAGPLLGYFAGGFSP